MFPCFKYVGTNWCLECTMYTLCVAIFMTEIHMLTPSQLCNSVCNHSEGSDVEKLYMSSFCPNQPTLSFVNMLHYRLEKKR